jgi:hypothetical protein
LPLRGGSFGFPGAHVDGAGRRGGGERAQGFCRRDPRQLTRHAEARQT